MIVMDKEGNIFDERRREDLEVDNDRREENINEIDKKTDLKEDE